jgi:hypothetical protein
VANPKAQNEIRIESFLSGERFPDGCLFYHNVKPGLNIDPEYAKYDSCASLRKIVASTFAQKIQSCAASNADGVGSNVKMNPAVSTAFFVSNDLSQTRCLLMAYQTEWNDQVSSDVSLVTKMGIGRDEKFVAHSYLNLDTNKLFGCYDYGAPIFYWKDEYSPAHAYGEETARWQKQYLIRTPGFRHICWDARRIIDEPKQVSFRFSDGTVMLLGNRSILRVRANDGSSDAPHGLVKIFDPVVIRKALDEHGAKDCQGEALAAAQCPLIADSIWHFVPGRRYDQAEARRFYRLVIEAVDTVLQEQF